MVFYMDPASSRLTYLSYLLNTANDYNKNSTKNHLYVAINDRGFDNTKEFCSINKITAILKDILSENASINKKIELLSHFNKYLFGYEHRQIDLISNLFHSIVREEGISQAEAFIEEKLKNYSQLKLNPKIESFTDDSGVIYSGFENGMNGQGKITFPAGEIYEGMFEDGQLVEGKITLKDGTIYEGVFEEEKLTQGKITLNNGDVYEGKFQKIELESFHIFFEGKKTSSDGTIEEGIFEDNRLIKGKKRSSDGSIEEGKFQKRALIEGTMTFVDGTVYQGEFINAFEFKGTCSNPLIIPELMAPKTWQSYLSKLGLTTQNKSENEDYISYQKKLMFGFSIGQRNVISEFMPYLNSANPLTNRAKENFTNNELTLFNELEGSYQSFHLLYLFRYLEGHIQQAQQENRDPKYIQALGKLKDDLELSLPIALCCYLTHDEKTCAILSQKVLEKLKNEGMKTGGHLFIPTSCLNHGTLLILKKMDDGWIRPIFYNTGHGLEEHRSRGKSNKEERVSSKKGYIKAPISTIYPPINLNENQDDFQLMLKKILQNGGERTITGIHDALEEACGQGTPGKSRKIQLSGVCSFQCISAALKDILGAEDYLTYKINLLSHMQDDFQSLTHELESSNPGKSFSLNHKLLDNNGLAIEALKTKKNSLIVTEGERIVDHEDDLNNDRLAIEKALKTKKDSLIVTEGERIVDHGSDLKILEKGKFRNNELIEGIEIYIYEGVENMTKEGEFKNGKLHGKGKLFNIDGNAKEGIFVDGELIEGINTWDTDSGIVEKGLFKNSVLFTGTRIHKDGSISKYENGKKVKS